MFHMIQLRILSAILMFFCTVTLAQEPEPDQHHTLIIISTGDIHGHLEQFPKLATVVKQYREQYPHVLLVDSGDFFVGNLYVDNWEQQGRPITILMDKLRYDVATIGHMDLHYGQKALRDHIKGMPSTRFISTNVFPSATLEGCFSSHINIPLKGTSVSVGFIGLSDLQTTDIRKLNGISWKLPHEEEYRHISHKFRLSRNTLNVVLSHLGYGYDQKMMKYTPNIDIILGGHTHVMLPKGLFRTGTLLEHTGYGLSHVGVTTVTFSSTEPVKIISRTTRSIALDDKIPNDPEMEEAVNKIIAQFPGQAYFNRHAGSAGEDLSHPTIGTFFCKAIQRAARTDLALYNRSNIWGECRFRKGPITIKDIYEMEPLQEKIIICSMTKADIEQLILSKFIAPFSDEGGVFGIYCSGFSYQIKDGTTPYITSTLKKDVTYTVAMGEYLCHNMQFPQQGNGQPTDIYVRQALLAYLREVKTLFNPPPPQLPIIKCPTFHL